MAERSAADTKIKSLEEQMTLSEDNISKVIDLVKILNPVSCTEQEKNLIKSSLASYSNKISVLFCVAGKIESLGFKDNKYVSNKILITEPVKFLTIEDCLRDTSNLRGCNNYEVHHEISKKFLTGDLMKNLIVVASSEAACISQTIFNYKKLYELCIQTLVGYVFDVLDSKITKITPAYVYSAPSLDSNKSITKTIHSPVILQRVTIRHSYCSSLSSNKN